jgi:hypothetical protein
VRALGAWMQLVGRARRRKRLQIHSLNRNGGVSRNQ